VRVTRLRRSRRVFDLKGRRALVTGSSRGIGRALAIGLARQGADVVVHGFQDQTACAEVVAAVRQSGVRALAFDADLAQPDQCFDLAQAALKGLGGIDIFVSNAGIDHRTPWLEIGLDEIDQEFHVNFRATVLLSQQLAPGMIERKSGRIVALGSVQEQRPNLNQMIYAAAKSAQSCFVRALARELGPHGITANVLAPGAIETDQNAAVLSDPAYRATAEARVPAGRLGSPEDCAGALLLLVSDEGAYINGETVHVDGGWRA